MYKVSGTLEFFANRRNRGRCGGAVFGGSSPVNPCSESLGNFIALSVALTPSHTCWELGLRLAWGPPKSFLVLFLILGTQELGPSEIMF
jgi:hypothetical protein